MHSVERVDERTRGVLCSRPVSAVSISRQQN